MSWRGEPPDTRNGGPGVFISARALLDWAHLTRRITYGTFRSASGCCAQPSDSKEHGGQAEIDQATAEKAIAALGEAHHEQGDTVELAAAKTGVDAGMLSKIVEQIGGEGSLSRFSQMLDADHDGNPFDDLAGHVSKLFGKN